MNEGDSLVGILLALSANVRPDATVLLSATDEAPEGGPGGLDTLRSIPSLLYDGRKLAALALCHDLLRSQSSMQNEVRQKILELRKMLEATLMVKGVLTLSSQAGQFAHLLPRRRVFIGRPSTDVEVDVAIDCRWLSRADRNLALSCEGESWSVADLGSTNGHFIDGERLNPGRRYALPIGETCIQVGDSQSGTSSLTLRICRPARDPGAAVISFESDSSAAADAWPEKDTDLSRRWIVFREQIGIGGADCALPLEEASEDVMAAVRYQSGFWILPSAHVELRIEGTPFRNPLPLPAGVVLGLADSTIRILGAESLVTEPAAPMAQGAC